MDGKILGEIVFDLQYNTKRTGMNFLCLCTGEHKGRSGGAMQGKRLHYKGSRFHRIIPGFCIQGGDIINNDGTGGESIYGPKFDDEVSKLSHNRKYMLGMANLGEKNTNSS